MIVTLIMPTYNMDYIIDLAIKSVINQKNNKTEIELIIGDDGDDDTQSIIEENSSNSIIYKKFKKRVPLSDKLNELVRMSRGEYYGIIGSDDIQSPFKISSFEKALKEYPEAKVFGQSKFLYHDIIYGNTTIWTQNKNKKFFKSGSFIILEKSLFNEVNGYKKGQWKRIDSSFYKKIAPLNPPLVDLITIDDNLASTSIALQHIDNIWNRKEKGLLSNKSKQLTNFISEPINFNFLDKLPELYEDYNSIKNNLIEMYQTKHPIRYFFGR